MEARYLNEIALTSPVLHHRLKTSGTGRPLLEEVRTMSVDVRYLLVTTGKRGKQLQGTSRYFEIVLTADLACEQAFHQIEENVPSRCFFSKRHFMDSQIFKLYVTMRVI